MTDKKQMSVNESLAKVNKILRSAGDLILPRETNIALSILADVACQQQEEIYDLRVYAKLNSRRIDRLNEFVQRDLLTDEAEHSTAQKLLQAVDELATVRVSGEAGDRAQKLFLIVQDKARALIGENELLLENNSAEPNVSGSEAYIFRGCLTDSELINFLGETISAIKAIERLSDGSEVHRQAAIEIEKKLVEAKKFVSAAVRQAS